MKIAQPSVELLDYMGSDLSVVNAARVSFAKESEWEQEMNDGPPQLTVKDQKLISYLAKHGHWSPYAHNSLTFRIKAPIFVARQLVKHQVGGVWNEVSRRYVDDEPEFYLPTLLHEAPKNAKQGAGDILFEGELIHELRLATLRSLSTYLSLLQQGVAPEEARMVLPLNCMTEWWWTGSLMFFARVCKQRLDSHAQSATREIAQLINNNIPQEFQHSWKALMA